MSFVPLKMNKRGKKEAEDAMYCCYHQLYVLLFAMEVKTKSEVTVIISCYPGVLRVFLLLLFFLNSKTPAEYKYLIPGQLILKL